MNIVEEIKQASQGKKIKDLGANGAPEAVSTIIVLLGLGDNKIPDENERMKMYSYIVKNLGHYSLEEISLAGTLFIKGHLDYQKELYDKISPLFIENIMQSFTRYRQNFITAKGTEDEPTRIPTYEELARMNREMAISQFNLYRRTKTFLDCNSCLYRYMVRTHMLRLSYSQIKDVIRRSRIDLEKEHLVKANRVMTISEMRSLLGPRNNKTPLREMIKYNAVRLYFDAIIKMKDQIENYLP